MIKFGTSGHRGIIGETFTNEHVKMICIAISQHLKETTNDTPHIVIGYDPRQGNSPSLEENKFTTTCVNTLQEQGINVSFCKTYTPTPLVSWYITTHNLDGGLILTASHNPPEYNGIKFNTKDGAPASENITSIIEKKANTLTETVINPHKKGHLNIIQIEHEFSQQLIEDCHHLYKLNTHLKTPPSIAIDVKHGACATTWKTILKRLNIHKYAIIHEEPRSDFGNINPNPTKYETLNTLKEKQKQLNSPLAFANDPDGDRHVILDETGTPLTPEETTTIIYDYLQTKQIALDGIATTLASSSLIKSATKKNNQSFYETAVGFKYFAPLLQKAKDEKKLLLAVESSGGFSTSVHTFEKCGFLPCILLLLIIIETNQTASQLKKNIQKKIWNLLFRRRRIPIQNPGKRNFIKNIKHHTTYNHPRTYPHSNKHK